MKQKLIALAVGSAILAPSLSLAEPVVYGRVDVSLDMVDAGFLGTTVDNWQVNSNSSRFGIKGTADLDNGLMAVYKLEYELDVADGNTDGDEFKKRNIYAGIEGMFGQLIAGTFDTPSKKIQGKLDLFKDHNFDFKEVTTAEYRMDNTIQYTSPKLADAFEVKIAVAPGEELSPEENDGIADMTSVSISYQSGPFYAGLSADSDINSTNNFYKLGSKTIYQSDGTTVIQSASLTTPLLTDDRWLLALGYHQDMIRLGFLYESSEDTSGNTEYTGYILSGGYQVDNVLFKAQYGAGEWDVASATVAEQNIFAIGLDYALAAKTHTYVEYTSLEGETSTGTTLLEEDVFAVGMLHKF